MSVFFFVSASIFCYVGTECSILSILLDPHQGAFYGIMVGHVCGVIRMAMDFAYPGPGCDEEETRPSVLFSVHYTYFGVINFFVSTIAIVLFSYTDKQQPDDEVSSSGG